MDILKILEESASDLIPEDLDFFETELATGGPYDEEYQEKCRSKIQVLRNWMNGGETDNDGYSSKDSDNEDVYHLDGDIETDNATTTKKITKGVIVGVREVLPDGENSLPNLTPVQQVQADVKSLRERSDYKSTFKNYVRDSEIIDENFLDRNFGIFTQWELDAIVSVKPLSEEFLEKYFGAIDHDKIARYQLFSEGFFMNHFSQLDATIVLEQGKNEWRKKENRSSQLDVFLRLKGVKI